MRFDLDRYKLMTDRLRWDDLDIAGFATDPLADDDLRCLRYMHDVEYHTACYLRDLLSTRAHEDSRATAFLTFWAFEEFWHGEAIAAVLRAHGEPAGDDRINPLRKGLGFRSRISPALWSFLSLGMKDLPAVHMTWGAVNEWTTQAGYARLSAKAQHPVLSELLSRIMKQEGRHIDFYASEAHLRLGRSPSARKLTRWALRRAWTPVGAGVMPDSEVAFLIRYLFDSEDGEQAVARIDRRVSRLPGQDGLGIVTKALRHYQQVPVAFAPRPRSQPVAA
ncbi:MAG TPA: ferritin-like domain-containing protein [Acidimicrobiales bacterium]|nr:ferritin-like domain-containing protein [Acidimicrobiales bacterium]